MGNDIMEQENQVNIPQYNKLISGYKDALRVVDDVILKQYITQLSNLDVIPLNQEILDSNLKENVLFFKVSEMVYEKDEFASYKFASVFNALSSISCSIFVVIDSFGDRTDFYMGVRSTDENRTTSSLKSILKNAMIGQFPGIKTKDYTLDEMQKIIDGIDEQCIASVSCVANTKSDKLTSNKEFVQGLEKLVLSMQGQQYTGIIIANTTSQQQLHELRKGYESTYTQLSPLATAQINYGQNESFGKNVTHTAGTSDTHSTTESDSRTIGESNTHGTSYSHSISHTEGVSKEGAGSKIVKGVATAASLVGSALAPFTGGASLAVGGVVAGGLGLAGSAIQKTKSKSDTEGNTDTVSDSYTENKSYTYGKTTGDTHGVTESDAVGTSETKGSSNAITMQAHDKSVEKMLERIDKQLERIAEFESLGMFECAAYFLSESQYASEMAASTYKAIVGGKNTGVEVAAVNCWNNYQAEDTKFIAQYVKNFIHPVFKYVGNLGQLEVTPGSMVSANELAIHMGLPRKSVCGLPVIEHCDFGKEVVNYDGETVTDGIKLGKVFNMGYEYSNPIFLNKNSLTMHTFVTGSTGSGKSNTIYELIRQCNNLGANFMVIEPAKGEYKHVFGNRPDVNVFGTNPQYSDILRINPFKFPKGIHVLEHVDRLVEIFNVCWPMYAAMPAVLKEALLKAYEECGWDFSNSKNAYDEDLFPTFIDLQEELVEVINDSAYSEEVKSNYMGSLVTRVKSLTNGLNGQIFTSKEIDNSVLFDKNVVIDLSRIGSLETKSLIMGLLIMRLSEHRMTNASSMNVPFKHMTVLEEAHNILKRTSTEQNPENPSVAGKSVEMISNAIAEMRTYGEGFVIVDQSPTAVDISAIRNTNTKIIMRLPDESDRRLAGKSAGLRDDQLDEIAKLPKGVAVVYQNDWVDPILCKVQKYKGEESEYQYEAVTHLNRSTDRLKRNLLGLLLRSRVNNPFDVDMAAINEDLKTAEISSRSKMVIKKLINEYELSGKLSLWNEDSFESLSKVVSSLLNGKIWTKNIVSTSSEFDILTDRLMNTINDEVGGLSAEYGIAISQCLMKAEATESQDMKEIYSAWVTNLRSKGVF